VFAEPKVRRRARASSRGGVWRKPNPKMQGDVQEPDLRCGTSGTSGHVTTKSSIRNWGVLYKSGVYALKVTCLTLGDLHSVSRIGTEGEVIHPDRCAEVSRRHSRRIETDIIFLKHGRTRNPPCNRKSRCRKLSA
jgi:hypothetical protein